MAWEQAQPVEVPITIDIQCYPRELQTRYTRRPIHELALALLQKSGLRAYEIAHALDSVSQFWERYGSGDTELEDFETDFDGDKRRAKKKAAKWLAHAISVLEPEDECPACKCGTVEVNDVGALVCRGECGATLREAPDDETEPDGSQQGEADAEEEDRQEGSPSDDRGQHHEEEDQGAR